MNMLRYIYYKLFCIWIKKKNEQSIAHINAAISMALLTFMNIISVPLLIMAYFGKDAVKFPEIPKLYVFIFAIFYQIIFFVLFGRKKKIIKIYEEFSNESEKQKRNGNLYIWFYIIISISIPLYIFLFTIPN